MCQSLLGSADVATHHSGSLHTNDWFHFYFNAWGNFWHVALGMCDTGAFKCTGSPNYVWVFLIWASFVMQFFFHNLVSLLRKEVNHYQQHILNAWVILHILLSQAEPSGQHGSHSGCCVSGQVTIALFTVTSIGKSNVQRASFPIRRLLEYFFYL